MSMLALLGMSLASPEFMVGFDHVTFYPLRKASERDAHNTTRGAEWRRKESPSRSRPAW
jgi:hypothetical protein